MASGNELSSQGPWSLRQGRANMLSSGQFSDCHLHCATHCFRLHRSILMGCRYFRAVFGGKFEENRTATATSNDDPALLARVLQFIYYDDYSTEDISAASKPGQGQFGSIVDTFNSSTKDTHLHASMYSIGDRFCLPQLKTFARQRFIASFFTSDNSAPSAPAVIIVPIVEEVYSGTPSTDRGLRDLICMGIHMNLQEFAYDVSKPLLEYLDQPSPLSQAVWVDLMRLSLLPGEYRCQACGDVSVVLKRKCSCPRWGDLAHMRASCVDLFETACLVCSRTGTLVGHVEGVKSWGGDGLDRPGVVW